MDPSYRSLVAVLVARTLVSGGGGGGTGTASVVWLSSMPKMRMKMFRIVGVLFPVSTKGIVPDPLKNRGL